ncbi:MAG TPA: imelysin family protein [Kofleriaceae bacterium]|nr:imelysin family protein [Kofleriaceae bacterium]
MRATAFVLVGALAVLAFVQCTPVPLGDGKRRVIAHELIDEVIVPTLDDVLAQAQAQTAAMSALASAPSAETLAAAREAWRAARVPWKQSEAFAFGPATDLRLAVAIDQTPIDPAKLELLLASPDPITEATIANTGANAKGFHALEYLLFGDDATVLAGFAEPRRRELVVALAQNLEHEARALREAWVGDYAIRMAEPGAANTEFPTIQSVIDTLVNESVFLAEVIANTRLGKPLGVTTGGVPDPSLQESGPSDNSTLDIANELRSIRAIYVGSRTGQGDRGISALIDERSPATDRAVRDALDAADAAVAAIPRPFATALVELRPEVTAAHEAVKELKRVLATEVVGTLGATLKFNDNDGD